MRFSKLRLTGFKSFVDPVDLTISEGLTGVVGPNGCGKSNLLEALRWVMGENRPTSMRGDGMEDVIFSGSATRPARNFAEVILILDNKDRSAPSYLNDRDSVEITRRVTRDIGSAYKTNGNDVRARDVHMLFADASTGAHSPSLVRQGQIAEIINAKPKGRRQILEEAAGISGLYQRRHEAELKLKGAEDNLGRIEDLIDQLAAQLQQLARQARQASRYRELGDAIRQSEGALLYRRWREADDVRAQSEAQLHDQTNHATQAEISAQKMAKERAAHDNALPPLREEESAAAIILQRLIVQKDNLAEMEARALETLQTLQENQEQLFHDLTREEELQDDAKETITRLQNEEQELNKKSKTHDSQLNALAEEAHDAAVTLQDYEMALSQITEDAARLAARHQSAQRLMTDNQTTLKRSTEEAEKAYQAMNLAEDSLAKAQSDQERARAMDNAARKSSQIAEEKLLSTEVMRAEIQARESEARAQRSEAEGELGALRAEALTLGKLIQQEITDNKQLIDVVHVDSGYEKALGAALMDDLYAPIVKEDGPSGWILLPEFDETSVLPDGIDSLTNYVTVPDALMRRITQVGVVNPDNGHKLQALLKPGQRLVSLDGDMWRWDGYRAWSEDSPSTSTLRLEQINRLEALKQDMERVSARVDAARLAHESLTRELEKTSEEERLARQKRREADEDLNKISRTLSRAEAERNLAEGQLETQKLAVERHNEDAAAARQRLQEAQQAVAELANLTEARLNVETTQKNVETARAEMMAKRSIYEELRRDVDAQIRRLRDIKTDIAEWQNRQNMATTRAEELTRRQASNKKELHDAKTVPAEVAVQRDKMSQAITEARNRKAEATERLSRAETIRQRSLQLEREAERAASDARENRASAAAKAAAAHETLTAAAERIKENLQMTPDMLLSKLDIAPENIPASETLEIKINGLRRQRDALGAVNLRAEDDAREIQDKHDILSSEKSDLTDAIKELRSGIQNLNREGRERLLTAFEQVNMNFATLFKHLFGGGEAKLEIVEDEDPLKAGLEVLCQPPGKKLANLSLLSGGEQTLTALAIIFAVFLANPSPICVLDEVDAPLDDANVARFCDLLDQMCQQTDTRFLIITHHAVTMSRMDRLYGVTMAEQGVSQLVSVDLTKAESLVA
ncbi:MAG: AAA family ATPase [Aestuariivita sp.]|nr:AAA family ATPase [Aestuariivita sp.]